MEFPPAQATLHTLPNGLTLILDPDCSAPVISAQAWVETGSQHESDHPGAGMSHLIEHMLFKGTKSWNSSELATTVQGAGGHWNAYTTFDRTVYYIDGPAHSTALFTKILFEMVFQPRFPLEDFETEKDVIRREIDMGLDDPDDLASKLLFETAYQKDLRRHPVIGHLPLFNALTHDHMVAHHRARYTPENTFFCLSGDFDAKALLAEITDLCAADGDVPRSFTQLPIPPTEPLQLGLREVSETFETTVSKLCLSWKTPGLAHRDTSALELLSSILGGGRSSILYSTLREKEGLAHYVASWNWSTPDAPGLFSVSAEADPDKKAQLHTRILEEIGKLTLAQIEQALPKVKRQITVAQLRTLATASGRASDLASNWHEARSLNFTRDYLQEIADITPQHILDVAQKYLIEKTLTITSVDPKSAQAHAEAKPSVAQSNPVSSHTLSNGLRVVLRADRRLPTLNFQLAFRGGLLADTPETSGLGQLHAATLLKGTATRSAQDIAEATESLGARLGASAGNNSTILSGFALTDDLPALLDLTTDVLLNPTFPSEALDLNRDTTLAAIKENALDPLKLAFRQSRQTLFGEHGYGLSKLGTADTLPQISSDSLLSFHQAHLTATNGALAISGHFEEKTLLPLLEKTLGQLPGGEIKSYQAAHPNLTTSEQTLNLDKEQAALVISYAGAGVSSDLLPALNLLQEYTSDMAGPLFTTIREEHGLAYYVSSSQFHGLGTGYFGFYLGTSPEQIPLARQELEKEIQKLIDTPIDEATLDRVKATFLAAEAMQNQSNASMAQLLVLNTLFDLGLDNQAQQLEKTKALTPLDLQKAAQQILQNPTTVTVTP